MSKIAKCSVAVVVIYIYPTVLRQRQTLTVGRPSHFYCNDYFVFVLIRISLGVSSNPLLL